MYISRGTSMTPIYHCILLKHCHRVVQKVIAQCFFARSISNQAGSESSLISINVFLMEILCSALFVSHLIESTVMGSYKGEKANAKKYPLSINLLREKEQESTMTATRKPNRGVLYVSLILFLYFLA